MLAIINQLTSDIAKREYVEQIILFGSRARKDAEDRSDIDLAIWCPKASRKDWIDIVSIVNAARTLHQIDIVRLDEASQEFRERVLQEGKILYERI